MPDDSHSPHETEDHPVTRREHDNDKGVLHHRIDDLEKRFDRWWARHDKEADAHIHRIEGEIKTVKDDFHERLGEMKTAFDVVIANTSKWAESRSRDNRKMSIAVGTGLAAVAGFLLERITNARDRSAEGIDKILGELAVMKAQIAVLELEAAELLCEVREFGC